MSMTGFLSQTSLQEDAVKLLRVPTGMGREIITDEETNVSAPSTSESDFRFKAIVKHSIQYV